MAPVDVKKAMIDLVADFSKEAETFSGRYHQRHLS